MAGTLLIGSGVIGMWIYNSENGLEDLVKMYTVITYVFKEIDIVKPCNTYVINSYEDAKLYLKQQVILEYAGKYYKSMKPESVLTSVDNNNKILFLSKLGQELCIVELK